ncbi:MAG: DNA recombination/repair protein RecA, partial [Planctomycetota bacterium]|nr:DNA recombination/repair protein RecA [Planctomycetota bacterium]
EHKIIVRSGTWFRYGDLQLGQGRERARQYLKDNREITDRLRTEVLAAGGYHDMLEGAERPQPEKELAPA